MNSDGSINDGRVKIRNYMDDTFRSDITRDVYNGLTAQKKTIPSKYFYDARGSALFDEICSLPEYYPTRTELSILREAAKEIVSPFQRGDLVELGSGANMKIRTLLDAVSVSALPSIRYVPVDVSESALIAETDELLGIYPELNVLCVVADFVLYMESHPIDLERDQSKLICFFGSTIGNLGEEDGRGLLKGIAESMNPGDRFLLGIDMLKPKKILEAAYNDSKEITAAFNKNVLNVLNRELNANFNPSDFDHVAFFNEAMERVEMHLCANRTVSVEIDDLKLKIGLDKGETIRTEMCRKFSRESADRMFDEAGMTASRWFTDPNAQFAVVELESRNNVTV